MKVTVNWLRQYVDFDWSAEELAHRLTMLGLEVEAIHKRGGLVVKVARPGLPFLTHITETALNDQEWDYEIDNRGDLQHLHGLVIEMLEAVYPVDTSGDTSDEG